MNVSLDSLRKCFGSVESWDKASGKLMKPIRKSVSFCNKIAQLPKTLVTGSVASKMGGGVSGFFAVGECYSYLGKSISAGSHNFYYLLKSIDAANDVFSGVTDTLEGFSALGKSLPIVQNILEPISHHLFWLDFISLGTSCYDAWGLSKSRDTIQEMKDGLNQNLPLFEKAQIVRQFLSRVKEKMEGDFFKIGLSSEGKTKVKEKICSLFTRLNSRNVDEVQHNIEQSRVVLEALKDRVEEKLSWDCHSLISKTVNVAFTVFMFFFPGSILLVGCLAVSSVVGSTFWFWEKGVLRDRDERIENIN
jgi:hypothetical protein